MTWWPAGYAAIRRSAGAIPKVKPLGGKIPLDLHRVDSTIGVYYTPLTLVQA